MEREWLVGVPKAKQLELRAKKPKEKRMIFLFKTYLTVIAVVALVVGALLLPTALLALAYEAYEKLIAFLPRPQAAKPAVNEAVAVARQNLAGAGH